MAVPQHDWRSLVRQSAVALLLLLPLCIIYWHSISGDAAIYFTFVKRFFELPFSYQPHQVSFGATSPLHVVLHAPLYLMFGDPAWLSVSKALSLALIPVGVTVINRAIRGTTSTLILGCLLAAIDAELFITAAELFETSLAFAIIALLFCSLVENRIRVAALLTGLLYLVRPELALVAVPIAAIGARHLSGQRANRRDVLPVVVLVVAPAVLYHAYIWLMSGALLPSSVYARSLTAMETTLPWTARLKQSWSGLRPSERWFYGIGGVTATAVVASGRARAYLFELIFLIPIAVL